MSASENFAEREKYQRSGRLNWARFVMLLPLPIATAALTGLAANHVQRTGFYLPLLAPLLFECVKQRYRIPAQAIIGCECECTMPQAGRFAFYATVLQANVVADADSDHAAGAAAEVLEAPMMVRPVSFVRFNGPYRQRSYEQLGDDIRGLIE